MRANNRLSMNGVIAAVAAFVVLAGGGAAFALTTSPGTSAAGEISACYLNTGKPGKAVLEHIASNATCPHGYKKISWNAKGPMGSTGNRGPKGPAGVTEGLTVTSAASVNFATADTNYTVLTSPAAQVAGNYYVTASIRMVISAGAQVGCNISGQPGNDGSTATQGPASGSITLPIVQAVLLPAGGTITVICADSKTNSGNFVSGGLNAILVNNSVSASAVQPAGK